jgi:hypothetical protein
MLGEFILPPQYFAPDFLRHTHDLLYFISLRWSILFLLLNVLRTEMGEPLALDVRMKTGRKGS